MLVHDLRPGEAQALTAGRTPETGWEVLSDDGCIKGCVGCFGCWLKTPGLCLLQDGWGDLGARLARCGELVLVSRCCYGGPSPFVKNVIDRSLGYIHPNFTILDGRMHHRQRYEKILGLTALFYGEGLTAEERETAEEWVRAAGINFYCDVKRVAFAETPEKLEEYL